MIDLYQAPTGPEAMLRFGPAAGPVVVAALPLFEEANRTRAFVVTILRALAVRGIAGALPDLPGQGESLVPTEAVSLLDIREGHEAAVAHVGRTGRPYAIGVRSGALLDVFSLCFGRWQLAPQDGPSLLRELERIRRHGAKNIAPLPFSARAEPVEARPSASSAGPPSTSSGRTDNVIQIAGNLVSLDLLADLPASEPFSRDLAGLPLRVMRLEGDPQPADRHVPGPPLWRRAEPGDDPALAALLADDIAAWVRACEG